MSAHPLRSYAFGDLSSNYRGRSGDQEVGALLDHRGERSVRVTRHVDGRLTVVLQQPNRLSDHELPAEAVLLDIDLTQFDA